VDGRASRQVRGFEHFVRKKLATIKLRLREWLQAFC
jgi:hypothetical protein